jgi:hypothetical protein
MYRDYLLFHTEVLHQQWWTKDVHVHVSLSMSVSMDTDMDRDVDVDRGRFLQLNIQRLIIVSNSFFKK